MQRHTRELENSTTWKVHRVTLDGSIAPTGRAGTAPASTLPCQQLDCNRRVGLLLAVECCLPAVWLLLLLSDYCWLTDSPSLTSLKSLSPSSCALISPDSSLSSPRTQLISASRTCPTQRSTAAGHVTHLHTCPLSRHTTPHRSKVTVATLGVPIILLLLLLCCMCCVLRRGTRSTSVLRTCWCAGASCRCGSCCTLSRSASYRLICSLHSTARQKRMGRTHFCELFSAVASCRSAL